MDGFLAAPPAGGNAVPSFDLQFPPRTLVPGGLSLGQNVGANGDQVSDVQTLGPRGTPAALTSSHLPGLLGNAHRPWRAPTIPEAHAGLRPGRVRAARLVPRRAPILSPRALVIPGPSPSASLVPSHFVFAASPLLPRRTSDSKSASLRSFPGITQHKLCRPTTRLPRGEEGKRCRYSPPSFRHFL